jgi:hypothetical protein
VAVSSTRRRALSVSVRREEGRDGREEEDDGVRTSKGYARVGWPKKGREGEVLGPEEESGPKYPFCLFFFMLLDFSIFCFPNFEQNQNFEQVS